MNRFLRRSRIFCFVISGSKGVKFSRDGLSHDAIYSAAYVVVRCLSVILHVTLVYCVETAKHIFTICLATPFLTVFIFFFYFLTYFMWM